MIDFAYVAIVVFYVFLFFSLYIKEYIFCLFASLGIMSTGIYFAIHGVGDISNFLTTAFGIINIGIGAYVFIVGSLQKI